MRVEGIEGLRSYTSDSSDSTLTALSDKIIIKSDRYPVCYQFRKRYKANIYQTRNLSGTRLQKVTQMTKLILSKFETVISDHEKLFIDT